MIAQYPISDPEKIQLAGPGEENFIHIEKTLGVKLVTRHPGVELQSEQAENLKSAEKVLNRLRDSLKSGQQINLELVRQMCKLDRNGKDKRLEALYQNYLSSPIVLDKYGKPVHPKSFGQAKLIHTVENNEITLVTGPAGTGKTFLAVAIGVSYFLQKKIERLILVRPAVESGENLGYLPGDLKEKIAPYMTPLYDALRVLLPPDRLRELKESEEIEIAPLAYMRGRTLGNCFLILDEAQNTTISQMKMFLTRLGHGGKILVTGDETQKDLPVNRTSGLHHAKKILRNIKGVGIVDLDIEDVVRNPIVREVIRAYEQSEVGRSIGRH